MITKQTNQLSCVAVLKNQQIIPVIKYYAGTGFFLKLSISISLEFLHFYMQRKKCISQGNSETCFGIELSLFSAMKILKNPNICVKCQPSGNEIFILQRLIIVMHVMKQQLLATLHKEASRFFILTHNITNCYYGTCMPLHTLQESNTINLSSAWNLIH